MATGLFSTCALLAVLIPRFQPVVEWNVVGDAHAELQVVSSEFGVRGRSGWVLEAIQALKNRRRPTTH
jgi:hypothetical protein